MNFAGETLQAKDTKKLFAQVWGIWEKILCTPKNLPAPTLTCRSLQLDHKYVQFRLLSGTSQYLDDVKLEKKHLRIIRVFA